MGDAGFPRSLSYPRLRSWKAGDVTHRRRSGCKGRGPSLLWGAWWQGGGKEGKKSSCFVCEYESERAFSGSEPSGVATSFRVKAQVLLRPTKPCPFCPIPSLPSPPPALPLAHSVPVLQASLVFPGHIKQGPSSGPSHLELGAHGGDVWTPVTCSECGQVHARVTYVLSLRGCRWVNPKNEGSGGQARRPQYMCSSEDTCRSSPM